jgi:uncharacterized delta-60 repeat protein
MRPAFARIRASSARLATLATLGTLAGMAGCSLVLGFEDTTVRAAGDGGSVDGGGPATEGGPPDAGASKLSVKPTSLVLRRGGSADLTVDLARGAELTGTTVTAQLSGLPTGVSAAPATIAPTATTAVVHLTAAGNATLGSSSIMLAADGSALAPIAIPLLVADPPGSLDVTFDADGLVSDPSRGVGSTFLALAVQPDGKIIAAGGAAAMGATLAGWVVRRYAANGVPDTAFNTLAGAAGTSPAEGQGQAVAVDAKGNIVCVGFTLPAPGRQLTVMRLLPTGALDKTFSGNGIVRLPTEVPATATFGLGVAIQPDGAIVVAGSRRDTAGTTESGIITRFLENGSRDTTFSGGATIAVAGARFVGVAADGDGFLVGGSTIGGALPSYFAMRRSSQGVLDATFGSGGTATFGNTYRANAFARLADGSIALAGDVQQGAAGYTAGVATPKGAAVFARAYGAGAAAGFFGIAVQADGPIIAAGHTAPPNGEARVERILPDGNKDTTFGAGGTTVIEAAGTANGIDVTLFAAAVQADGRILTAGNRTNAGAVIYRLWP